MATSLRGVFDRIASFENLWHGYRLARRGQRGAREVIRFELDLEANLWQLRADLLDGSYRPGPYRRFLRRDVKLRKIAAPTFRDRVLHQAIGLDLAPFLERKLVPWTYACRPGRGQHACLRAAQDALRRHPFCLKLDIRRYFPSIDHLLLKGLVARLVGDARLRGVLDAFVDSCRTVYEEQEPPDLFPGDRLHTPWERGYGLVLGALLSQYFANLYLDPLDRYVTEGLRLDYLRYMDDFLIFGERAKLLDARDAVAAFLAGWRLRIHERKARLYPSGDGVPFLGFRQLPWGKRLLRRNVKAYNARRKLKERDLAAGRIEQPDYRASCRGWMAHAEHACLGMELKLDLWRKARVGERRALATRRARDA